MCRNIKTLYNLEPPVTEMEIQEAALQFVRKVSGYRQPSRANEEAFNTAVAEVTQAVQKLMEALQTKGPPRDRDALKSRRVSS